MTGKVIRATALLMAFWPFLSVQAGYPTVRTDIKPLWRIAAGAGDTAHAFDTPEQAFATVQAAYAQGCSRPGAQVRIEVFNFRPSPTNQSYVNDIPSVYIYDYSSWYCSTGQPQTVNSTGGQVVLETKCPDTPSWTMRASGSGANLTQWCEWIKAEKEPARCDGWWGNPIHPATGVKKQVELDYRSANGLLKFERTYRSDIGQFSSVATTSGFFDYSASRAIMNVCFTEQYCASRP